VVSGRLPCINSFHAKTNTIFVSQNGLVPTKVELLPMIAGLLKYQYLKLKEGDITKLFCRVHRHAGAGPGNDRWIFHQY